MTVSTKDSLFENRAFVAPQLPPHDIEIEESVLGGILLDPNAIARVKDILSPPAFYSSNHEIIYRTALKLHEEGKPTDMMTVASKLRDKKRLDRVGGVGKIAQLVDRTVSAVNIDLHANSLMEKYQSRRAIALGQEIAEIGYDNFTPLDQKLERIERMTIELTQTRRDGSEREERQYNKLLNQIKHIQLNISHSGQRQFAMMQLARKTGENVKSLELLYYHSLCSEEYEPPSNLGQLRERYGNDVREWLMHGFLPKGAITLLHAMGGLGKTRLAYDFIYHLSLGLDWNGFPVTANKRKILIIQTDEQPSDMIAALELRGITEEMNIDYITRWTTARIPQLYQLVEENRYDLILIDSLSSASRFSTVSENDTEFARPILLLNQIAKDFGAAIVLIHHSSKAGVARGTTAIYNAVSQVFQLAKDGGEDNSPHSLDRLLIIEKSRARRPATYKLQFEPEDGSWYCTGEKGVEEGSFGATLQQEVLDFLKANPNTRYENTEIQSAIGCNDPGQVRRATRKLSEDGTISRQKRGRKSYLYWVQREAISDAIMRSPHTKVVIASETHTGEGIEEDAIMRSPKNQKNPDTHAQENPKKNNKSSDRMIASPQNPDEVIVSKEITPCDHLCDHHAITYAITMRSPLNWHKKPPQLSHSPLQKLTRRNRDR